MDNEFKKIERCIENGSIEMSGEDSFMCKLVSKQESEEIVPDTSWSNHQTKISTWE